jgi:SNF2 family DNA or RNA helicase
MLVHLVEHGQVGPFLVLGPLSILDGWRKELEDHAPGLELILYTGNKDHRKELRTQIVDFITAQPPRTCVCPFLFVEKTNKRR